MGVAMDFWFAQQQDRIWSYISHGVVAANLPTSGLNSIHMNKVFWVNWDWEAKSRGSRDTGMMHCQLNTPGHDDGNLFNQKSSSDVHVFHLPSLHMQFSWLNMMIIQMSLM